MPLFRTRFVVIGDMNEDKSNDEFETLLDDNFDTFEEFGDFESSSLESCSTLS